MGREKDAKGNQKTKHKATKLKRLNGCESAGAGGESIKNRCVCVCARVFERERLKKIFDDKHSLASTLSLFHHERLRCHYQISSLSHRVMIAMLEQLPNDICM